jgi:hypothetical protein
MIEATTIEKIESTTGSNYVHIDKREALQLDLIIWIDKTEATTGSKYMHW